MVKEAVAEHEKAVALSDENPWAIATLICDYYLIGKKDQAKKLFESLKQRSESKYIPATSIAIIYRVLGEENLALQWLKRAFNEHDAILPLLRFHPTVTEGSRYMTLFKEMGL